MPHCWLSRLGCYLRWEFPEPRVVASSLGTSIVTQGDDLAELRRNVRDAVECHIDLPT